MTHADVPGQGTPPGPATATTPPAGQAPFPPAELTALHTEDRVAATHIVGLMLGIFVLGVIGYLVVCYWIYNS